MKGLSLCYVGAWLAIPVSWPGSMRNLTLRVYRVTRAWPLEERYGLTSQVRRSAVSVCANIAEGAARQGPAEFARFVSIASGSLGELACLLEISHELGYVDASVHAQVQPECYDTGRLLGGLRRSLARKRLTPDA